MKIKLCGLTRMEDIEAVNQYRPDYIGFVFADSRRKIGREKAAELKANLNPSIQVVGVFVNESISNMVSLCREHIIDVIQLHGDEGEDEIKELRMAVQNPIIQAVRVRDDKSIKAISASSADYLLLDAYHPGRYGGSGKCFDWELLHSLEGILKKPYFLAGGIGCHNIEEAAYAAKPYAIDVSSGVETDGYKDPGMIGEVMDKIRRIKL